MISFPQMMTTKFKFEEYKLLFLKQNNTAQMRAFVV